MDWADGYGMGKKSVVVNEEIWKIDQRAMMLRNPES
jgi:hypothetical protein